MRIQFTLLTIGAAALALCSCSRTAAAGAGVPGAAAGAPTGAAATGRDAQEGKTMEQAVFAAGCFWGVEAAFRAVKGVRATRVGYTGGTTANPTYGAVCSDRTGHAEAVEVTYDPTVVTYEQLLAVFWDHHDPTTPNRQGPDYGTQYRSAVFYRSETQRLAAAASRDRLAASGRYRGPIVTEIVAAGPFWPAEAYHQQYLEKRGLATCHQ